ncbi:hypothetical protein AB1Y20_005440 [Prymnesium parvum]|uniref:SAM domain-containing protein n=1 Tax=Prymnesium parvum TaxID=97485 RepID=A0AB34J6I8_PRYPA
MPMGRDIDIMGYQRGAHVDGAAVCPQYVFKIPGGTNPDGTALFGWNDSAAVLCTRCGHRDSDHVVIRDTTLDEMNKKEEPARPVAARPPAAKPPAASPAAAMAVHELEHAVHAPLQLFELEPGVADPLASVAYADAKREHEAKVKARVLAEKAEAARIAQAMESASLRQPAARAVSVDPSEEENARRLADENERFKAEVEAMVKQARTAPPTSSKVAALSALPPEGSPADVAEMLSKLNLSQYIEKFEEEGMELSVLIALARGDGKEALDEALKEAGVKSVGHRLKIFAALQ